MLNKDNKKRRNDSHKLMVLFKFFNNYILEEYNKQEIIQIQINVTWYTLKETRRQEFQPKEQENCWTKSIFHENEAENF